MKVRIALLVVLILGTGIMAAFSEEYIEPIEQHYKVEHVGKTFHIFKGKDKFGKYIEIQNRVGMDSIMIETDRYDRTKELIHDLKQFIKEMEK